MPRLPNCENAGYQSSLASVDVVSEEWLSACAEAKQNLSLQGFKHADFQEAGSCSEKVHSTTALQDCPAAKRAKLSVSGPEGGSTTTKTSLGTSTSPKKKYVVVLMVREPEVGSAFFNFKDKCKQACKADVHAHCAQFAGEK